MDNIQYHNHLLISLIQSYTFEYDISSSNDFNFHMMWSASQIESNMYGRSLRCLFSGLPL